MSTILGYIPQDSHVCSNSMFVKLRKSCINIRTSYEDKISRSRLSIYDPHKSYITYLYESRDFNVKKSNSVTNAIYSYTSINNNTANESLDACNKNELLYKNDTENNIFNISQMSRSKLNKAESKDLSCKAKEPVIIINQLNSNIDVSSVVDQLLADQEFSKVSSLYVVVPSSDDEDTPHISKSRFNSTKCMQLSEYKTPWNKTAEQCIDWPQRTTSNMTERLAVSLKGKQYFLAGLPTSAPYFKNLDIIRDINVHNNLTPKVIEFRNNKLCQITTPNEMVRTDMQQLQTQNNVISTDTTVDRPCCCRANPIAVDCVDSEYNDNSCARTVVSQMLLASNCLPEGLVSDSVEHVKQAQKKQAWNYLPGIQRPGSLSTCQINQCCVRGKCCATQNIPLQDPKCSNRVKFETIMKQSCKCNNPDNIKEKFDQMQAKMKSTACGEHAELSATVFAASSRPTPRKDFYLRSNQNECMQNNTKKTVMIKPIGGTKGYEMNVQRPRFEPKFNSYSIGCQSAFKDNYVVIGPCGRKIPVLGQTTPPFPASNGSPVSTAIQNGLGCLKCLVESPGFKQKAQYFREPSMPKGLCSTSHFKREVGLIEVMGPLGGYAAIGSGGACTQAGHKELRVSTAIGPGNAFEQVDIINMAVSGKESLTKNNSNKVNVAVTDEKGKTNIIVDEVEIDVTNKKSKTSDKIGADIMTFAEKIKSKIKGDDKNNPIDTANKKSKSNNLFGKINMSRIKKSKVNKANDQSAQTDKRKSNHKCECRLGSEAITDFISLDNNDAAWIDPKLLLQLRSELCQTTSGFIINKRGKKNEPVVEIDVSLEDAIRYYATLHPEVLSDLVPSYDGTTNIKTCRCESDHCCECPIDNNKLSIPQPPTGARPSLLKLEKDEIEQPAIPFKGLSLKMPGKGTGSQGLSNVLVLK